MVQLNYGQLKNQEIKHTIANSRGGRNINVIVNLRSNAVRYSVMEKKKELYDGDDLQKAIAIFNELELTPGNPTKYNKDEQPTH